jgi:hypothetical protein
MHPALWSDPQGRKFRGGVTGFHAELYKGFTLTCRVRFEPDLKRVSLFLRGVLLFGILLKGKPKVKCSVCRGEGYIYNDGSLKTCRHCDGKGYVEALKIAERALMRFSQPRIYRVSHEHSTVLVYQGYVYDEVLMALRVLTVSKIKAEIVFQI